MTMADDRRTTNDDRQRTNRSRIEDRGLKIELTRPAIFHLPSSIFGGRWSLVGGRWSTFVLLGIVLLIGVALRLYRLDAQKLWFDELYTAEVVRQGPGAIWRNSFLQLTPPLPYLLFWAAAQLGGLSALSLRMAATVTGIAALAVFYGYCASVAGRWTALLAGGLLAIAPLAVYYAQEARPYAPALLALLVTLLASERVRRYGRIADWGVYALLAAIAGQLHYVNVILVGAQLVALLLLAPDRRRVLIGGAGVVLAVAAALGPFMLGVHSTGREWANWQVPQATLGFSSTMQTMVAGDGRIAPAVARAAALAIVTLGIVLALLERRNWPLLLPHILQVGFLILIAFVLLPLAGIPAPAYEERPFLLVLPSALLCFSLGMRWLATRRAGWLPAVALVVALGTTAFTSLSTYFDDFVKSPEGEIAALIAARAQPGDLALGDAYTVDAALRFYYPELPIYGYRGTASGQWMFVANPSPLIGMRAVDVPLEQATKLAELMRNRRIWLLQHRDRQYVPALLAQYQIREEYRVAPFQAQLLERQ
jgi:4-amino-4-deoxy-L-arabinose transferase-like glycosyltransferase